MSVNRLNSLVSAAIWRAQQLEDQSGSAAAAWAEVSSLEEELAAALPVSEPEGRIARRGAVRAAVKAGDYGRAQALAQEYLADKEAPESLKAAIQEILEMGSVSVTDLVAAAGLGAVLVEQLSISNEGFGEVVLQYYRPVLHSIRRHGFSEEEARELTQETFLRVYKRWSTFRGESQLSTWIFQVARHLSLNAIRSRATLRREAQEVSLEDALGSGGAVKRESGSDSLEEGLAAERSRALQRALEELPPQMRRCVELRIDRDLKYREIAELMGISLDTVKAHLFQARQILRAKLSDYFTDVDF